eukprot:CAMPEP_0194688946 /NCGR_PEP_ID=MMETSP0295-20121207/17273_1 /TAXON_ID=39354 /ORGANISM="Heterosigma akashiwo, Strain CCMP2393" /LENGTH=119 /DNA_ID=CAMNT_0039577803 /DNA_START=29 /DNA_END=385 /DNA_ORIENTATION=+
MAKTPPSTIAINAPTIINAPTTTTGLVAKEPWLELVVFSAIKFATNEFISPDSVSAESSDSSSGFSESSLSSILVLSFIFDSSSESSVSEELESSTGAAVGAAEVRPRELSVSTGSQGP